MDRIPVIVNDSRNQLPPLRIMAHPNLTVMQLRYYIRKKMNVHPDEGIILMLKDANLMPTGSATMSSLTPYRSADNILYMIYSKDAVFG
jgi:hypothetical protein